MGEGDGWGTAGSVGVTVGIGAHAANANIQTNNKHAPHAILVRAIIVFIAVPPSDNLCLGYLVGCGQHCGYTLSIQREARAGYHNYRDAILHSKGVLLMCRNGILGCR